MTFELFLAEQEVRGKYLGKVECIRNWVADANGIPGENMSRFVGVSLKVFEGVVTMIKEHPDWDDEMIVDRADWR